MNDADFSVYNAELIALSSQVDGPRHIDSPDVVAKAVSPICGSVVDVELKVEGDRVLDFGYAVEACALTKTVVAVMQKNIVGKTRADIASAGAALEELLAGGAPALPQGWEELQILAPLKDYKARHNAMLLPFEAVEKAFQAHSS